MAQTRLRALKTYIRDNYEEDFRFFQAPGRVNLIGGHTDYNDGFVLPVAIDRSLYVAARKRRDDQVRIRSLDYDQEFTLFLSELSYVDEVEWINYVQGVLKYLREEVANRPGRGSLGGAELVITGDVPQGAGLSSSAALEVGIAHAFNALYNLDVPKTRLAQICQRAENEFVGVNCGIMDQFIAVLGEEQRALFLDCRSLEYDLLPFAREDVRIVVVNSNVQHSLVDSAYNQRLQECQRGVDFFQEKLDKEVRKLRDVTLPEFNAHKADLSPTVRKRCQHVISENKRVLTAREALAADDFAILGQLLKASHASLRDFYEVSSAELDLLIELALEVDGVFGARMTGAGFGGSTVNLVAREQVDAFTAAVGSRYEEETGIEPEIFVLEVGPGSSEIEL